MTHGNHFHFSYEFNVFSIRMQKNGTYRFEMSLHSGGSPYTQGWEDHCSCIEETLRAAIGILHGHQLIGREDLLEPDPGWGDLILDHLGPFLLASYRLGETQFTVSDQSGLPAAPRVTSEHPLYSNVMCTMNDLIVLFLQTKGGKRRLF